MLLWIWTRDDETGVLDDEFRDGDVMMARADTFEPSIGVEEKKSWLIVQVPDPPNMDKVLTSLERSEYAPGAQNGDDPVVRRKRLYALNWRGKFTAAEIALIEGRAGLPDGQTVVNGIIVGKFTIRDLSRKS